MSAGAEDKDAAVARPATSRRGLELVPPDGQRAHRDSHGAHVHHDHHILIEPEEDRWRWRRKIRQNPRKLFFYRLVVAFAGLFLVSLGFVSGPLPGPGGIPLVLLGLAIWASEFEWAHKLMMWFKAKVHRYRLWPRRRKVLFWICFFLTCAALGYLYLLLIGFPWWMPQFLHDLAGRLPGVG